MLPQEIQFKFNFRFKFKFNPKAFQEPTRALPWTYWEAYSAPRPPAAICNDQLHLFHIRDKDFFSLWSIRDSNSFDTFSIRDKDFFCSTIWQISGPVPTINTERSLRCIINHDNRVFRYILTYWLFRITFITFPIHGIMIVFFKRNTFGYFRDIFTRHFHPCLLYLPSFRCLQNQTCDVSSLLKVLLILIQFFSFFLYRQL